MSGAGGTTVACSGCAYIAPPEEPLPFTCPNAGGDDIDHVMVREVDPARARFPLEGDTDPFVRYRELFHGYHLGRANGMSDEEYMHLVRKLDKSVSSVDGRAFEQTPLSRNVALSRALGCSVWVKDETGNVSGSHKARHLMGLMLHLLVARKTGLARVEDRELAIASCGNAALAAAIIARAAEWPIRVFVPTWADPGVMRLLRELEATIEVCERESVPGDPTYRALRRAIAEGAVPFTCQGPDNGLTIEGGQTLAYELISQTAAERVALDRLIVQVGGGALASSCIRAFQDASLLRALERWPRFHAVQTARAHPLERAYKRLHRQIGPDPTPERVMEVMDWGRSHRSEVMWPWEEVPTSVADGILDDETYDWAAVVEGMFLTQGGPILVSEDRLREANDLARSATGIEVSYTGSAGLAGLLELAGAGDIRPAEHVGVIFTGVRRD